MRVPALVYCVVSLLLWWFVDAVFIPEVLANRLFEILPVAVIESGVQLMGAMAKRAAFIGIAIVYFGAYWWFAANWDRIRPHAGSAFSASFLLWGLNVLVLFPLAGKGFFGYALPQGALSSSVFLFATHWIFARMLQVQGFHPQPVVKAGAGRRVFVVGVTAVAAVLIVRAYRYLSKPARWSDEVTPAEEFYTVSKNSVDPVVSEAGWKLEIRGLVHRPTSFVLSELKQLPSSSMFATLACISNPVGGPWIGNARWTGVPLASLLETAGLKSGIRDVVFHAADGYTDSIPLERAMHPLCLLAYEMNNAPLTSSHGFPLRLIVPGIYGMKNVKWITAVELVDHDYRGFWQTRGWDDGAPYKLMSRIDIAKDGFVAGIAFAGDRGVKSVKLKIGDQPWQEAELQPVQSPLSWVRWSLKADVKARGVMVRMVAADGEEQIAQPRQPFPEGSTGLHTVVGA